MWVWDGCKIGDVFCHHANFVFIFWICGLHSKSVNRDLDVSWRECEVEMVVRSEVSKWIYSACWLYCIVRSEWCPNVGQVNRAHSGGRPTDTRMEQKRKPYKTSQLMGNKSLQNMPTSQLMGNKYCKTSQPPINGQKILVRKANKWATKENCPPMKIRSKASPTLLEDQRRTRLPFSAKQKKEKGELIEKRSKAGEWWCSWNKTKFNEQRLWNKK